MNKAMNKLLLQMVQYDLGSGLFISLIIGIISTFTNAGSYLAGISVAMINFFISTYVISRYLGKQKKWFIVFSSFLRMGFVLITILPFIKNMKSMIFYIIGFSSHYIMMLIVFSIKNRKGSV
jgi:ATP synthase protein I